MDFDTNLILGWTQSITTEHMDDPGAVATLYMQDIRMLERQFGVSNTYSTEDTYQDLEIYSTITSETVQSIGFALCSVIIVILFITFDIQVTILIVICVSIVDFYIASLISYWGVTLNSIISIQLSLALGVSVDYSLHIAHTYMLIRPPTRLKTA